MSAMRETTGNLWDYYGEAVIVITTNGLVSKKGRAVFGPGCGREAAERFPDIPLQLGRLLAEHGNHVHLLGENLVSFPVENTPYERPDLQLIERSARELALLADREEWQNMAVPRPGCGNGGLDWRDVRPLLMKHLDERFLIISR